MEHPGMSIFEGSEGLHLDTNLQHLEEDEAEEDQKRRNKEVLQPFPCSVWDILIIFNTYCLISRPTAIQFTSTLCYMYIACLVYIFIVTRINFCECQEVADLVCFSDSVTQQWFVEKKVQFQSSVATL